MLAEGQKWLREVLYAGWAGGGSQKAWQDLLTEREMLTHQAGMAHPLLMAHGPELPQDRPADEVAAMLGEIVMFIEAGGALGIKTKFLTRRAWHRLIGVCLVRVEDREPRSLDEFHALRALAQLGAGRKRFAARWRHAVEGQGGPKVHALDHPERMAMRYAREINARLDWRRAVWEPLIVELRAAGFRWDAWLAAHPPVPGDQDELARVRRAVSPALAESLAAQAARLRQTEIQASLRSQRTYLAGFPQSDAASVLLQAQDEWNVEGYEESCLKLALLEGLRDAYQSRMALLQRLETTAPTWAQAIAHRHKPHDAAVPPGDVTSAWRWRQWLQELERRAALSINDLQPQLDSTEMELLRVAAQIIERETWAALRERTGLNEQQALMGYVQTIQKIGGGTGRRVPELLIQARRLLADARRSVPVWIMPLSRVYESFDPRATKFDVVIIDESSQSDVTALAALYLGREHIVVGDDKQVTPKAIGQKSVDVDQIRDAHLKGMGIKNYHLYDGQTSIYDLAKMSFGGILALTEHFRCVPEIIQFSNHLSYDDKILPLREPSSAHVRPALVAHRVEGICVKPANTNKIEAEEIASLVCACLKDPEYSRNESGVPASIGVISLLGDEQALLIDGLLRQHLRPDLYEEHRLLCGNSAQFQGDERDIVFLSMVDDPPENGKLRRLAFGDKDENKKRYNVAASRARNQLWVVHSLDPEAHLKGRGEQGQVEDLRRQLILHARDPNALIREIQGQQTDSVFEQQVLVILTNKGYRVRTQWPVGAYRIDLVVEGLMEKGKKQRRLAVECDGERWHTRDNLGADLERQAILERLGWIFVRIRGSVFFRDPDLAMAPVFSRLDQLGINPQGFPVVTDPDPLHPLVDNTMVDRIRRAAQEIRQEWIEEQRQRSLKEVAD